MQRKNLNAIVKLQSQIQRRLNLIAYVSYFNTLAIFGLALWLYLGGA